MNLLRNYITTRNKLHIRLPITTCFRTSSVSRKVKTVLGIETSCDDTGCAVVNDARQVLGESLRSQNLIHLRYGGINPIVARELHRDNIDITAMEALKAASLDINDIDAIAVTTKPGLLVSLQIGVKYARYLARLHNKPLIPIHHMEAHALVARMYHNIPFPFLVLLISGGHCLLAIVKDVNDFLLLGETLDNAPGEVMDKAARRMKLKNIPAYAHLPGGQAIESAARNSKNPILFEFPLPLVRHRDCNFSFSGLKDFLIRKILEKESEHGVLGSGVIPEVHDLCAAFQLAIAKHLVHRTERAMLFCEKYMIDCNRSIVVSGGVACNDFIFNCLQMVANKMNYNIFRPPTKVCTDNGIMIAWNGVEKLRKQCDIMTDIHLKDIEPMAPLGKSIISEVKSADIKVKTNNLKDVRHF